MYCPGQQSPNPWIAFSQPIHSADMRLFCFPHAGGGASFYRQWSNVFGLNVEVCPVQLPGRENRIAEPPVDRLDDLLDGLDQALTPLLDRPFAFFGHSLGALIGFELARKLARGSKPTPMHLFVSASPAPSFRSKRGDRQNLSDADLLQQLADVCTIPLSLLKNREAWQLFLPALRADFAINDAYGFSDATRVSCPISIFGAADDELVMAHELHGWSAHTSARARVRTFTGGHFYLRHDPSPVQNLIRENLASAFAGNAGGRNPVAGGDIRRGQHETLV